jgi:CubicO group peptidase (beta-lactamase class C family)
MSLNDYFQEHIFKPIGVKNINMFPTEHMKENLAWMHTRAPDGKLSLRQDGHLNKKPLWAKVRL